MTVKPLISVFSTHSIRLLLQLPQHFLSFLFSFSLFSWEGRGREGWDEVSGWMFYFSDIELCFFTMEDQGPKYQILHIQARELFLSVLTVSSGKWRMVGLCMVFACHKNTLLMHVVSGIWQYNQLLVRGNLHKDKHKCKFCISRKIIAFRRKKWLVWMISVESLLESLWFVLQGIILHS